ncbi:MAG: hypothetical protein HY910_17630 [Desulfarculus sp.]|nr:hypothetical protein [Desulfarculus sp.]
MRHLIVYLVLALAWSMSGWAGAGQAASLEDVYLAAHANDKINLCGYYRESGRILQIKQSGNQVKGYFSQGQSRCVSAPNLYFQGTLSGPKFTGTMTACNPAICVDAGQMEPTRQTEFSFVVHDQGRRLVGTWLYHSIEYKEQDGRVVSCSVTGSEQRGDFIAEKVVDDCASLKQALLDRKNMLSYYTRYHATSTGAVVNPDGREVAGDFNSYQAWVEKQVNRPSAAAAGANGAIEHWEFDEVMAGRGQGNAGPCWCKARCTKNNQTDCQEPWAEEECQAHEASHCQTMVSFCKQYILGKSRQGAWQAWQAYSGDTAAHMADEVKAYQASINYLEQKLKAAGCK